MATLCDPASTTIILVARPEISAITEAARTSAELRALGLSNQRLIANGVFWASDRSDATAASTQHEVLIAGVAGLVVGAMSMAAGEYVPSTRNPTPNRRISGANARR